MAHAPRNLASIGLELCFSRPARANAAAKLRHLHATTGQPWKQVLKLREFYLELTFAGTGVSSEDVED